MASPLGLNLNPNIIPTGYEDQLAAIARKRAIADAMTAHSMQPGQNFQSITQPLAQLFEAWSGKHMGKEADSQQAALNTQRIADSKKSIAQVMFELGQGPNPGAGNVPMGEQIPAAVQQTMTPAEVLQSTGQSPPTQLSAREIVAKHMGDPGFAGSGIEKILSAQAEAEAKNSGEYTAPIEVMGSNGQRHLRTYNKAGGFKDDTTGVNLPTKLGEGPVGQLYDPYTGGRKVILPDVSKEVYLDENGNIKVNQPLVGAKSAVANAGKTTVNTSTYVNAMDKSFGKVIPEATVADLTKSREAALAFKQTKPELDRASQFLNAGIFNGFAANTKLDVARAADAFGITGKDTSQKIARTQAYVQNMGRQLLPILQALRPASDTDVKTAQMMSGGDLSLSPGAMRSAINAAREGGATAYRTHNDRVKTLQKTFGRDPDIAAGLSAFEVPGDPASPSDRVAAEIARRKGGK